MGLKTIIDNLIAALAVIALAFMFAYIPFSFGYDMGRIDATVYLENGSVCECIMTDTYGCTQHIVGVA